MTRKSLLITAIVAATVGTGVAIAQNQPSKADLTVVYRKALYQVMYNNFAVVAGMATGRAPYDAKLAQQKAARANYVTQMLGDGFPADSADGKPTRAKPELWANRADFDKLLGNLQKSMMDLEKAAKTGKPDALKTAFQASASACKACHDKYRTE